jgi:hypothetical protein
MRRGSGTGQEAAQRRMAVLAERVLRRARQEVEPVPQRRQRLRGDGRAVQVERGGQRVHGLGGQRFGAGSERPIHSRSCSRVGVVVIVFP